MKIRLSVIIPAYNESENFKKGTLIQVDDYLKKQNYPWEVIIVNDGSVDLTAKLLEDFIKKRNNWRLINETHKGKAAAVLKGILEAEGQYILFSDFDQATPISEVHKLLQKAQEGFGVVIGSREMKGAKRLKEPFYRHLMGKGFNILVQLLVIRGIHDTQCGFKLFETNSIQKIISKIVVYKNTRFADAYTGAFDVELLYLAKKLKIKVCEVPIDWHHVKTNRVNPVKDSLRMFMDIFKIRLYSFLGKYES